MERVLNWMRRRKVRRRKKKRVKEMLEVILCASNDDVRFLEH
jgi:hypothetical protein